MIATSLLVVDDNNDSMFLNVYNYVLQEEDSQDVFPPDTYLAILEPYLRFARDDPTLSVNIRCGESL